MGTYTHTTTTTTTLFLSLSSHYSLLHTTSPVLGHSHFFYRTSALHPGQPRRFHLCSRNHCPRDLAFTETAPSPVLGHSHFFYRTSAPHPGQPAGFTCVHVSMST